MAGDFPDIPFVQAAGDGGLRNTTQMVVIHATDNTASDEAEASYASHRPDQISAHFFSDEDSVIQGVLLTHVAYGCYPTGNSRSIQFELCGISGQLTDATMRRVAPIVKRVCDRYGIPIVKLSPADLRAGARGICGHGDVTLAWGEGTHTDPGASFPWDMFLSYIGDDLYEKYDRDRLVDTWTKVTDIRKLVATPPPVAVTVDKASLVAALSDPAFLSALAKAVNEDAARRMAA